MEETEETSLFTSVVPATGAFGVWLFSGVLERKRAAGRTVMMDWRTKSAAGRRLAVRKARAVARMAVGANIVIEVRFIEV